MSNRNAGRGGLIATAVTIPALVATLVGCTATGTKAGPDSPAVVLHLATVENAATEYFDDVSRFADKVAQLTAGSVTIQLDPEVPNPWTPESEQVLTTMVKDGSIDLAVVAPRVFDTIGIHGFEALQTPFLISSAELAGAITSSDFAAGLLAGLSEDGLVGLGLFYDGLRRPLIFQGALTKADQFHGLSIRVPISGLAFDMFQVLGAVPDSAATHRTSTAGDPYQAAETQFEAAETGFPTGSTFTANVVFYPKFSALLANPDTFNRLTGDQQDAIWQAARDTAAAAVADTADDEALAEDYCEGGSHVLLAPESEVEAIRTRVAPLVDKLRADPETGEVIAAIESLAKTVTVPAYRLPPACAPPTGDGARIPTPPPPPSS